MGKSPANAYSRAQGSALKGKYKSISEVTRDLRSIDRRVCQISVLYKAYFLGDKGWRKARRGSHVSVSRRQYVLSLVR